MLTLLSYVLICLCFFTTLLCFVEYFLCIIEQSVFPVFRSVLLLMYWRVYSHKNSTLKRNIQEVYRWERIQQCRIIQRISSQLYTYIFVAPQTHTHTFLSVFCFNFFFRFFKCPFSLKQEPKHLAGEKMGITLEQQKAHFVLILISHSYTQEHPSFG